MFLPGLDGDLGRHGDGLLGAAGGRVFRRGEDFGAVICPVNLTEGDAVSAALVAGPDHCCVFSGGQWQAESGVLRAGSCRQLGACAADAGPQGRASALQARGVAGRRLGRPRRKR